MTVVPRGLPGRLSARLLARFLVFWLLALASAWSGVARADATPTRQYTVVSPDGVPLSVQEYGDPSGTPVIFVHGLLGSHLSWQAQVGSPALQRHRLITFDLRGHGQSGKPSEPERYVEGRRWGQDLASVISASGAQRPVLVGWSLGAAVISNYLAAQGDAAVAGVVYVGGVIELDPAQIVPHPDVYRDMNSADLRTRLDAERAFIVLCFHRQPGDEVFQRLLANASLASFDMQRVVHRMSVAAEQGLRRAGKPMLQIYGEQDALVRAKPSADRARALNPAIRTTFYEDAGHAPFVEAADRFNAELVGFVEAASGEVVR
ncbi:alpha/beta fold hydrolase [Mitsuaria sp. 7]|uniref:alpha/beta fold hydrolase n=1 Tax=Mitsuaria sp. 7 TaxID=1658665 RepID=UPI0007DDBBD2|nr:alpha/beta hydrolase [Mitsuaria sp. 7]ANH68869.1 alpha/beta hydrolase [Mitsuaria sp. 7]